MSLTFIGDFIHSAARGISSLVFPDLCPCCLREGEWESCIALWRGDPSLRFIERVPIISTVAYDDRAMSVVLAAKERGERRAREFVIVAISNGIAHVETRKHPETVRIIVPIPSSEDAIRRRGEDFIQAIAKEVARGMDVEGLQVVLLPILRWKRATRDQSELNMRERIANLVDSMEVDEGRLERRLRPFSSASSMASGRNFEILLIDDVITSGSTMAAAISAISHSSLGVRSTMVGITACYSARGF